MRRDTGESVREADTRSPEAVLASGHWFLRFPWMLEAQFQVDTLETRRKLLLACGLVGCLGVVLGSVNSNQLMPEIGPAVWRLVWIWECLTILCLLFVWRCPPHWRKSWHAEALTTVMATSIAFILIWVATASHADTAFTHAALACVPVMYQCIAARQRFYWALTGATISFASYALIVKGFTPQQALITDSALRLMALSYVFVLAANYAFEHRERRNWLLHKQEQQLRQTLQEASERLHQLSILDPLTGLPNRRQFDDVLSTAWQEAAADRLPISLLIIDIDYFKLYNDTLGHPAGDSCLIQVGQILADVAQAEGGSVARMGGEEFGIVLPHHTLGEAQALGERLCRAVFEARIAHDASTVEPFVTVSVGVAQDWASTLNTPLSLIERADSALYVAKQQGRNRVSTGATDDNDGQPPRPLNAPRHFGSSFSATPAPANEQEAQATPEATLSHVLGEQFTWLSFPPEQEALYCKQLLPARRKHLLGMSILGLIIYNGYVFSNRHVFPDVGEDVLMLQWWLSVTMMMLAMAGYFLKLPMIWREALFSLGTSIIGVASTWVISHSELTPTLSYAVSLALIPMYAGVAARQPFWAACIPAVITCLAAAWMLSPHGEVQNLVYIDTQFGIGIITAFSLILAYTLEHGARKAWLLSELDKVQREALEATTQRLQQLSVVDALTGICNRRQFGDDLDRIWEESLHDQRPLAMLLVDIDHFKLYNDGYGHPQGDRCLKRVANLISQAARADKGLAARLGGEEFGILLPGARAEQAARLGERVCQAIREANIDHIYVESRHVTVSVGVASALPHQGADRMALFAAADKALYEAKRAGRDRVIAPRTPVAVD